MSGEAVGWAFRKVQMDDPTAKFVLVAICNYADANDKAWPSHNDISRVTGLSKRAVQNSIKKLVDWGVVARVREFRLNGSENNPTVYLDLESRPVVVDGVASGTIPPLQEGQPGVESGATLQTTDTKPQEKIRPVKPKAGGYTEDFETSIWQPYPRKAGTSKLNAFKKWEALSEADQALVRGALPAFVLSKRGSEEKYIPHLEFFISRRIFETVGPIGGTAMAPAPQIDRQTWVNTARIYANNSNWPRDMGPEPGRPGCRMPPDLQQQFINPGPTSH